MTAVIFSGAAAMAEPGHFFSTPDIHGDKVVFSREGDIWIGNLVGGEARRLTRAEGLETKPRFSPDGTQIAFQGQYEGSTQVYVMAVAGGIPARITNRLNSAVLDDWTPDGRKLLCRAPGPFYVPEAFLVPAAGGAEELLPLEKMGMGSLNKNNVLAFCRFGDISGGAWFRYEGGSRNDIWTGDLSTKSFRKVFESKTQAQYPQWVGDRIYFVHEENATWAIKSVDGKGGGVKRHTAPSDEVIFDLQTDGKNLIFTRGTRAEILDSDGDKVVPLSLDLNSDLLHARPKRVDVGAITSASVTPTGKRVLGETRGQIISIPTKEGETRLWKSYPGARLRYPSVSPDGKKVAYVSDETKEQQVYVSDADGNAPKAITNDSGRQLDMITWSPTNDWLALGDSESRLRLVKADGSDDREVSRAKRSISAMTHSFSPDGKWLVFVEQMPWTNQYVSRIMVHNIAENKTTAITSGRFRDDSPSFSSDGKWISFVSYRDPNSAADDVFSQLNSNVRGILMLIPLDKSTPSPLRAKNTEEGQTPPAEQPAADKTTKIDFDGIERRMMTLPLPSDTYTQVDVLGDRVIFCNGSQIGFFDFSSKSSGVLTPGQGYIISGDGKNLLIPAWRVVPVAGRDLPANAGAISPAGFKLDLDPPKEWEQIFWDAWRLCRDYFYVRNMHGVDWNAVGVKYAALLPQVRSRNELTELIRWMQAELSAGHSFRQEPALFANSNPTVPAYLGCQTVADGGFHRITRIFDGDGLIPPSPLMEPGHNVSEGDYILAVNGKDTPSTVDWREHLRDRVSQIVSLTVNTRPSKEGARTIYLRPINAAAERTLWERDTVKKRREYVDKASQGKIGYIFLSGMVDPDMDDFILQYLGQLNKEAIIVDIRGNNGGYISAVLVNILAKETYLWRSQRNSQEPSTRYTDSFEGHLCMLINEGSYSDGEGGPTNWRYAKLGPLIGTRTYGALVGSAPMWPLVDGGGIQVPRYGNYREDAGWVVEGPGVKPDIEVENDPNEWAKGRDSQLDRAIAEMLARIAKNPVKRPVQPADPVTGGTRGGR